MSHITVNIFVNGNAPVTRPSLHTPLYLGGSNESQPFPSNIAFSPQTIDWANRISHNNPTVPLNYLLGMRDIVSVRETMNVPVYCPNYYPATNTHYYRF